MKKALFSMFLVVACCLGAAGCGGADEEATDTAALDASTAENTAPAPAPDPMAGLEPEAVVATVNDTKYTKTDVEKKVTEMTRQFQGQIPPGMEAEVARQALQNLVDQQLLLEAASAEGKSASEAEIQQQYDTFAAQAPTPEQFQSALTSMGFTDETFRAEISKNLTIEKLLDEKLATARAVTPEDIEAYYQDNPDQFKVPEQVQASHILIKVEADDTPEVKAEKRQRLEALKKEIDGGADFAELAGANSDCPSKTRGGDLGLFTRERMVKPFADAAFAMEVGQVSDVVETQFGYHLIKLTDRKAEGSRPLDEVRQQVENQLDRQYKEAAFNTYMESLRGAAEIDYTEGFEPSPVNS